MSLRAVILTGLAAGLLRLCFGRPYGEGCSLAFAGAGRCIEQPAQVSDLSAKLGAFTFEFSGLPLEADAAAAGSLRRAMPTAARRVSSWASLPGKLVDSEPPGPRR